LTPDLKPVPAQEPPLDHGSHRAFFDYYAEVSESKAAEQRLRGIQATLLRVAAQSGMATRLDVADNGCGAGKQARMWAELGHRVHGLAVNEPLIELARQRATARTLEIMFQVGSSATSLPWPDASMDVCIMPELLEHVRNWEDCLKEAARVLRPGGLLYVTTTSNLCPLQEEFNLPFYSWYPAPIKQYCERLAVTTRPNLANFAKYPAVHWFSFYSLRRYLEPLGFRCLDRFDLIDAAAKPPLARLVVSTLRAVPPARFLGHVATPSTFFVAVKAR